MSAATARTSRPVRDRARIDAAKARYDELSAAVEKAHAERDLEGYVIARRLAFHGLQPTEHQLQWFRELDEQVDQLQAQRLAALEEYSAAVNGRPA